MVGPTYVREVPLVRSYRCHAGAKKLVASSHEVL
jgi:hypothetical protein